jgi:spermidine synthase
VNLKSNSNEVSVTVPPWVLLLTVFVTGNVIMMLEVVGTRVVGPFFGVGIYVWSALITVALLALSAGYWLGGRWADAKRRPEFLFLTILLAAVFVFLIPVLRNPLLNFAGQFGVRGGVLVGSVLLFGVPLFLLGIVSPYATKLFTDQFDKIGSRVGLLYSVSTLGSFLGTVAMGFYLIPNFPIGSILVALGMTLMFMPLVYFLLIRARRWPLFVLAIVVGVGALVFFPRAPRIQQVNEFVKVIYKTTSFYGEIKVLQARDQRVLLVDGVTQSGEIMQTHKATPPYVIDMSHLIARYNPTAKKALVIGLGGGNIVHALLEQNLSVDVVEIDKKIIFVATQYFGVDPKRANITLEDGRRFVRLSKKKYDVVVLNTFSGESSPSHMLTREFFQEVHGVLEESGISVLNFVGYVQGPHRHAAGAVQATLQAANDWCHVYFREAKQNFSNILFVAGRGEVLPEPTEDTVWEELKKTAAVISGHAEAVVCTDDYNPVDFLNRVVYRRWRQLVIDSLGSDVLLN